MIGKCNETFYHSMSFVHSYSSEKPRSWYADCEAGYFDSVQFSTEALQRRKRLQHIMKTRKFQFLGPRFDQGRKWNFEHR